MSFVTTDLGEILLLRYMLNNSTANDVRLHLYTNNRTPAESDVLSMYTESVVSGYSVKELPGTAWTFATSASTSSATFARQTFTFSATETVYGWYMTNQGNTTLIWAERFTGAPFNLPSGGGVIELDPKLSLE